MNLFLASQAADTIELLLPHLDAKPEELKVVFVTTAGNLYDETPWIERDRKKLKQLGFNIQQVDIASTNNDDLQTSLENTDIIFVAGGNTSYLLEQSHLSGFWDIVKEFMNNGVWYVGSSAGSVIAGPNIEYDKLYDEGEFGKELDSYEGFHFIDFILVPHADSEEHKPYIEKALQMYGSRFDMRPISDNQAYLVRNGNVELVEA